MSDDAIAYRHGIVAFIDVLGWSAIVDRSAHDAKLLGRLSGVMGRIQERIAQIVTGEGYSHGAKAHQFSDAHFLTVDKSDDKTRIGPEYVALWCRLLAREYLKEGLLVRGGVTIGQFYDSGFACFGPAITRAYRLEQEVSDPIVIIDPCPRVQDIFLDAEEYGSLVAHSANPADMTPLMMNPLAKTRDGRVFVDYLRPDVSSDMRYRPLDVLTSEELQKVLQGLRDDSQGAQLAARAKVEWFLRYASDDWRGAAGGFLKEFNFPENMRRVRRRLTAENYASVSTPEACSSG